MVLRWVDVVLRVVEIRGNGRDELGARREEELLKDGESLEATALHARELIAVLLAESSMDGVVETDGAEGDADGDESIHLVVLLRDLVVVLAIIQLTDRRRGSPTESNWEFFWKFFVRET